MNIFYRGWDWDVTHYYVRNANANEIYKYVKAFEAIDTPSSDTLTE